MAPFVGCIVARIVGKKVPEWTRAGSCKSGHVPVLDEGTAVDVALGSNVVHANNDNLVGTDLQGTTHSTSPIRYDTAAVGTSGMSDGDRRK